MKLEQLCIQKLVKIYSHQTLLNLAPNIFWNDFRDEETIQNISQTFKNKNIPLNGFPLFINGIKFITDRKRPLLNPFVFYKPKQILQRCIGNNRICIRQCLQQCLLQQRSQ